MPRPMLMLAGLTTFMLLYGKWGYAQSGAVGTVVVKEEFDGDSDIPDPRQWSMKTWNVPDTWQLCDGAIAGIYDRVKLKAKSHGTSLNSRLEARDIRVSYRVKLEEPNSRVTMIINAGLPKRTGSPIWHIGRVVARIEDEADVSIVAEGVKAKVKAGLERGKWYRFVVENIGTQWTVWVDGRAVATATLEHSNVDKESANFLSNGLVMLDDIVIERL